MRVDAEAPKPKSFSREPYRSRAGTPAGKSPFDHFAPDEQTRIEAMSKGPLTRSPIARASLAPKPILADYEHHHRLVRHVFDPNTPIWTAATIAGIPYNLRVRLDPTRKSKAFVINPDDAILHPQTSREDFATISPSDSDLYDYAISDDAGTIHPFKIVAGEIISADGYIIKDSITAVTQTELADKTAAALETHKSYFGLKNQALQWVEQPAAKPENGDRFWSELVLVDGSTIGVQVENQNDQWHPVSELGPGKGKKPIDVSFTPNTVEPERLEAVIDASLSPLLDDAKKIIDGYLVITLAAKTSHEIKFVLNMSSGLIYPENTKIETLKKNPAADQFVYGNADGQVAKEETYVSQPVRLPGPSVADILADTKEARAEATQRHLEADARRRKEERLLQESAIAAAEFNRAEKVPAIQNAYWIAKFKTETGIADREFISNLLITLQLIDLPEMVFKEAIKASVEVINAKVAAGLPIVYNLALLEEIVRRFHDRLNPTREREPIAVTSTTATGDAPEDQSGEGTPDSDEHAEAEAFAPAAKESEPPASQSASKDEEDIAGPFGMASGTDDDVVPAGNDTPSEGPFGGEAANADTRYKQFEPTNMGTPFKRHDNDRVYVQVGGAHDARVMVYIRDAELEWDVHLNLNFNPKTGLIQWLRPSRYADGKPSFGAQATHLEFGKYLALTPDALRAFDNNWIFLPSKEDATIGVALQLKIVSDPLRPGEFILERSLAESIPPGTQFEGTIKRINNDGLVHEDERMRYAGGKMTGVNHNKAIRANNFHSSLHGDQTRDAIPFHRPGGIGMDGSHAPDMSTSKRPAPGLAYRKPAPPPTPAQVALMYFRSEGIDMRIANPVVPPRKDGPMTIYSYGIFMGDNVDMIVTVAADGAMMVTQPFGSKEIFPNADGYYTAPGIYVKIALVAGKPIVRLYNAPKTMVYDDFLYHRDMSMYRASLSDPHTAPLPLPTRKAPHVQVAGTEPAATAVTESAPSLLNEIELLALAKIESLRLGFSQRLHNFMLREKDAGDHTTANFIVRIRQLLQNFEALRTSAVSVRILDLIEEGFLPHPSPTPDLKTLADKIGIQFDQVARELSNRLTEDEQARQRHRAKLEMKRQSLEDINADVSAMASEPTIAAVTPEAIDVRDIPGEPFAYLAGGNNIIVPVPDESVPVLVEPEPETVFDPSERLSLDAIERTKKGFTRALETFIVARNNDAAATVFIVQVRRYLQNYATIAPGIRVAMLTIIQQGLDPKRTAPLTTAATTLASLMKNIS
jgi:hypothetical protein